MCQLPPATSSTPQTTAHHDATQSTTVPTAQTNSTDQGHEQATTPPLPNALHALLCFQGGGIAVLATGQDQKLA
jgi:hypothetical protein